MSFELPEPLREQRPADPRDPAVDLVEAGGTHRQLADDQRGPAVTQHVDPHGDRAVVRVARHEQIFPRNGAGR